MALALAGGVVGCHKEAPPSPTKAPVSSPVPAPDGLLAEAAIRGPDALWGRLQQGVAGPLERLPQTASGALVAGARLDLTLASEIDGAAPAYAVVARSGTGLAWTVAAGLRDFDHARVALLEGKSPHFVARDADGLVVLSPAAPTSGADPGFVAALSPLGFLVFGGSVADLTALAPYATRTLPARPRSPHALVASLTHAALAGVVHDRLQASAVSLRASASQLDASLRAEHGGKAPDLGDPAAVIQALDDLAHEELDALADVSRADLTLDAGDDHVDVEVTVTPGAGPSAKQLAGLVTGDAAPLITLSGDTEAAILLRDDAQGLHASAEALEARAAAVWKPALGPKDTKAIHDALAGWADARGPWLTVGLELEGGPALTLRAPTPNADRATHAVGALIDLATVPAFKALLEARLSVIGVSTATASVPGGGATSIATFRRGGAHAAHDAGDFAVAWAATGELLHAAAATSAARALRASKDPPSLLGLDVALAGKLGALRDRASFVFLGRRPPETPGETRKPSVVLGLGRDRKNGWGLLEIDDEVVREALARWLEP